MNVVIKVNDEIKKKMIEYYKDKACEVAGNKCDKCEAAQEYNGKLWCAFDTVNRFIEWNNKYNTQKSFKR